MSGSDLFTRLTVYRNALAAFLDDQRVARNRVTARERTGWELNNRMRSKRRRHSPGGKSRVRLQDSPVACDEGDVDWKTHEKRMDRRCRGDHHRGTLRETLMSEEPDPACFRVERPNQIMGERLPVPLITHHQIRRNLAQQWTEKRDDHIYQPGLSRSNR